MAIQILKTVTTTVDVLAALLIFFVGVDKKDRKTIGLGIVAFIAANILAMWM